MRSDGLGMLLFGGLLCVAVVTLANGNDPEPRISSISKGEIKDIGNEVEFNCTVHGAEKFLVFWYKIDSKDRRNRVPLSTGEVLAIRTGKYSLNIDNATGTYTLNVKNLTESDTGFYECQILIDTDSKITSEVELQIKRAPTIIASNTTSEVHVKQGEPIEMHCNADGFPIPRISWKRESDALLPNGGMIHRGNILRFTKSHRDDRGLYYCTAENGVGEAAHSNVSVKIEFPPVITARRPRVGQTAGYPVKLECRVEAYPRPTVTWFKRDREIQRSVLEPEGPGDRYLAIYYIDSVQPADYDEYICRAENGLSEKADTKVELFATIIPAV